MKKYLIIISMVALAACNSDEENPESNADSASKFMAGTFGYDLNFLTQYHKDLVVLGDSTGVQIIIAPAYQGRVMTSTAEGNKGISFGWVNHDLIASGKTTEHINAFGGEERFWLGPEGGQYSIYFKGKDSFGFAHWQVPAIIDTISYDVVKADAQSATFKKAATVTNYSGTVFNIEINRTINLLSPEAIAGELNTNIDPSLATVAYSTESSIKNTGSSTWKKESGLLSIWLLAMLTPSDQTKVIIPFEPGKNAAKSITRDYFGSIPPERLTITDSFLVLNCDGKFRSKVGISPQIAKPIAGSFDFEKNILTITKFIVDKNGSYVNSKWELQKNPYKGDAVNAYNDGPLADGTQMGPFYEIESSSPAKELKPGETQVYKQSTFHFEGDFAKLEALAQQILGVRLSDIKNGMIKSK